MSIISGEALAFKIRSDPSPKTVELPKPTGKHKVGTVVYHWIDKKREEPWTKAPADHRQLMVQIWYPGDDKGQGKKAPYIFDLEKIRSSIEKYWNGIPDVRHHATLDLPVSNAETKYPLLVFSHGMNSSRFLYTSICQELASRGYVVAAIDHTYWGPGVAFPDGTTVKFDDGMIARDKLTSDEIDKMMFEGIEVMSADQAFVAEKLAELNVSSAGFKNRFDLSKMGSIGHSMGGMAATASCLKYSAFKVCVSLDGANSSLHKMPEPSSKAHLLLLNSQWGRRTPALIRSSYQDAWRDPVVAIVVGTKHNFYSDIPLIEQPADLEGLLEPAKAFGVISSYTVAFFDKHLKQKGNSMPSYPEMELVDLKAHEGKTSK
ncbi:MAG: alpha/beta hydrolase family protein [Pyrinomonadaceae bacterium]